MTKVPKTPLEVGLKWRTKIIFSQNFNLGVNVKYFFEEANTQFVLKTFFKATHMLLLVSLSLGKFKVVILDLFFYHNKVVFMVPTGQGFHIFVVFMLK